MGLDEWEQSEPGYEVIRHPLVEKALDKGHMRMPLGGRCAVPCRPFPEWGVCSSPACAALQRVRRARGGKYACPACGSQTRPARFVAVCPRGHLDEFPWEEWAHRGRACGAPSLREEAHGSGPGLAGYSVRCRCGASRTYAGATSPDALADLGIRCRGRSPWLDEARQECHDGHGNPSRLAGASVLASSLYTPLHLTAINIPESAAAPTEPVAGRLEAGSSEAEIKILEYECLTSFEGALDDFEVAGSAADPGLAGHVPVLKTVGRLSVVRALHGFVRSGGDKDAPCALSRRPLDWCPAVVNRGEGVFLALDAGAVGRWAGRPEVVSRCALAMGIEGQADERSADPAGLLLHTLAHALIRELSAVAGYGEASIRERIYDNGMLLYTASAQSDGGLGGLARQGEQGAFGRLMRGALLRSTACSRDPLCSDSEPGATHNGSACYACMMLPETSCEERNTGLDRRLLADPKIGFFAGVQ